MPFFCDHDCKKNSHTPKTLLPKNGKHDQHFVQLAALSQRELYTFQGAYRKMKSQCKLKAANTTLAPYNSHLLSKSKQI